MYQSSAVVDQNHIARGIDPGRQPRFLAVFAKNLEFLVAGMMGNHEAIAIGSDQGPQDGAYSGHYPHRRHFQPCL
jgi:hypothetical protein